MTNREDSCEDRIDKKLESRIKEFAEVIRLSEESEDGNFEVDDCEYEDLIDWINQTCLSYSDDLHYRAKKLELSWGGPADGFRFFVDETIQYYFQDWFDGATRDLYGDDYDIMKKFFDYALDFGGE